VAILTEWVKRGAVWPGYKAPRPPATSLPADLLDPNAPVIVKHLQAWYKADALSYRDGETVHVWPDSSGHGRDLARDLAPTKGNRTGGTGTPPKSITSGTINRRSAVRGGERIRFVAGTAGEDQR